METKIYKAVINLADLDINIDIHVSLCNSLLTTELEKQKLTILIQIDDDLCEIVDTPIWARPYLLEILGVLAFFTKASFIVNDIESCGYYSGTIPSIHEDDKEFIINGYDYLADFLNIEKNIINSTDKTVFFSVIDRYRKILWLESNNDWANTYSDEIILTCVHILELITVEKVYSDAQNQIVDNAVNDLISVLRDSYFPPIKSENIKPLIINGTPPLKTRVLFMLKKQGVLTERLRNFISEIIELRNAVAHGRNSHLSIAKFPLPPFFSLLGKKEVDLGIIKNLVGRVISIHFKLDNFQKEWKYFRQYLSPTEEEISNFINDCEYVNLDIKKLYKKGLKGITIEILSECLIKQQYSQKITPRNKNIQKLFSFLFEKYDYSENITQILLYPAILFFQEKDFDKKDKCLEIIKNANTNNFFPEHHTSLNVVIHYLRYIGHKIDVEELMQHIKIH